MGAYRSSVSFRVTHPTADLSDLGEILGLPVRCTWKVGEPRTHRDGSRRPGIYNESYCTMRVGEGHESERALPEMVSECVTALERRRDVLDGLSTTGGKLEFFIGWFVERNSGDKFDWNLLGRLAALRVSLDFDVYGRDEDEDD